MGDSEAEENSISLKGRFDKVGPCNFSDFKFKRILCVHKETKTVAAEGYFIGRPEPAVLILEKASFQENRLCEHHWNDKAISKTFENDIYYGGKYLPECDLNDINLTLIYPATEKHIAKYAQQHFHIVEESPELYRSVTLPFLLKEQFSLQWVFNILEHKSETERIVFEDPHPETGFILCSDLKWDGKSVDSLYLLALPFRRGIMSLRDLTQEHLPLLRNIYEKGVEAIEKKFSIASAQLRVFIHYLPSFYHLHVHFTNLQFVPPGCGAERAHLLKTVINNLEIMTNYYQISKLNLTVKESDTLFAQFESLTLVKRLLKK